ncbi:RelA/spoT family protein [Anaerorhabdus sp.]|jgi:ppGpp synthetase/RelA/SpoT-type nucleotidyltranferase|uniref:RelA/spoT family protein n=1 Tax=Anaerorhabdus sp. TaxID=1872524 RepID=UPI002FC5E2E5
MRLELFDFIDQVSNLLDLNEPTFQYVEHVLIELFEDLMKDKGEVLVNISSRIKSKDSLKEKLIRNKYYLDFETADEAIDALPDLIGLTLECRFISDENDIFKSLYQHFLDTGNASYQCVQNENVFLELNMPQPQLQRNGFTIYRIDGHMMFNQKKINFELQIKSLVHSFWSEVEHQVVYKNTQFVVYDAFMKNILGSIRDNLEVVDRQLQIVYRQLINQSQNDREIGMTVDGFKVFIAKAINDLVALKMNNTVGFTTDFRKCSSVLSQYIYIKDFASSEHPQYKMVEYFEHFNLLQIMDFDFSYPIYLEKNYEHPDPFCNIIGQYWESIMNIDFEWHVFFVMLFAIEPGNNVQDFSKFIEIIKTLIIPPSWYLSQFEQLGQIDSQKCRDFFSLVVAKTLVKIGKIEIIHEDKLFSMLDLFRDYIELISLRTETIEDFEEFSKDYAMSLERKITNLF